MATIIAGNQNKIPPELDASYRDICINANGHKITLSLSGSNITANGIAFAHGVVGYYKNEIINDASNNGYVYVTLTTNQDEDVEDSTEIFFSSVVLTELTPNISSVAGTYRMLVATITDGSITYQNKVEYPKYAVNADVAERVTGTIASNTKATTQPTLDNSTKVATTAFVQNAIDEILAVKSGRITTSISNMTENSNSISRRADYAVIDFDYSIATSGQSGINVDSTIGTVPSGFETNTPKYMIGYFSGAATGLNNYTNASLLLRVSGNAIQVEQILDSQTKSASPSGHVGSILIKSGYIIS